MAFCLYSDASGPAPLRPSVRRLATRQLSTTTTNHINIMKKWEYRIIDTKEVPRGGIFKGKSRQAVEAYLNELGEQGWEIVNFDAVDWNKCMAFRGVAKRERQ